MIIRSTTVQRKIISFCLFIALLAIASCATSGKSAGKGEPPPPGFVHIEGGSFQMGSNDGNDDEKPVRTVTLKGFSMSRYPVTQKEWKSVMGNNPSSFKGDNRPVENVSWFDAIEYCNELSRREGLTPAYTRNGKNVIWNREANGYRLPTEAEWEYAAKGGNGSPGDFTYSGSNNVDEVGWYTSNSGYSSQDVGTKKPNALGLYDMSGNVWEWCWDWSEKYPNMAQTDPTGPNTGFDRVVRGGSWRNEVQILRSSFRYDDDPSHRLIHFGFRVVRP